MRDEDTIQHSLDRDETILPYFDAVGDSFGSLQKGLNWKWNTLKSTANIYIQANKQAFKLVSKSAKGVSSLGKVLSTYILADL